MAKRHHSCYTGVYSNKHNLRASLPLVPPLAHTNKTAVGLPTLTAMVTNFFWTTYATMNGGFMAIVTLVLIVVLSFILPDLSQKIHRTNELKAMKKVLHMIKKEVSRAEVACMTVAEEICCLHCSMHDDQTETLRNQHSVCTSGCLRTTQSEPVQVEKKIGFFRRIFFPKKNTSHKEVTLMSYLYTDSFDAEKPVNYSNSLSDLTTE